MWVLGLHNNLYSELFTFIGFPFNSLYTRHSLRTIYWSSKINTYWKIVKFTVVGLQMFKILALLNMFFTIVYEVFRDAIFQHTLVHLLVTFLLCILLHFVFSNFSYSLRLVIAFDKSTSAPKDLVKFWSTPC